MLGKTATAREGSLYAQPDAAPIVAVAFGPGAGPWAVVMPPLAASAAGGMTTGSTVTCQKWTCSPFPSVVNLYVVVEANVLPAFSTTDGQAAWPMWCGVSGKC